MGLHVIVGAGPIGTATAKELTERGHQVRMITRSGSGPDFVERVAADATDADRLTELATGADAIYNCANPPYHQWAELWPPLAAAILDAAKRTGAVLVTMSNLYGYGPVDAPMTEQTPLKATSVKGRIRAQMWRDALAAHERGEARVTEARASDFIGPGAHSLFTDMVAPPVQRGRTAYVPADLDAPHSLTYTGDVGRTLAVLGTDPRALGRAWHVPTTPATTLRRVAQRYAELAGAPAPKLRRMPVAVLRVGALAQPVAREFLEVRYQFDRPFIVDSSAVQETFGLRPTPIDDVLTEMVAV
jgi:nucleoside-diphosphate-sugar epimerase